MESLTRRAILHTGLGLGLGTLLPRADASRAAPSEARSLVLLWLDGGPSQLETWDPHRRLSTTRAISTSVPGLEISDLFPHMAERMHRISLIRSLVSPEGDHERGAYAVKTGYRMDPTVVHPSLGALAAHEIPSETELPAHVSLCESRWPSRGGYLGPQLDAFQVADPSRGLDNLEAPTSERRFSRRLQHLDVISRAFPRANEAATHRDNIKAALSMMRSRQLAAFDITEEPLAVRETYGDHAFGRGCLVARRLLEHGVRSIEVTLRGFDSHAANHDAHAARAPILDAALAALLDDLVERDLLRSTVILCVGELGRTPRINALDGRGHWSNGFSCLLGGGGIRPGQVVGATDPDGRKPPVHPVPIADLAATVLAGLGIDPAGELYTPGGRPMPLSRGRSLARLLA